LIATAAGLFAAIPAVIAYNYFLTRIRRTAFGMDSVVVQMYALFPAKGKAASIPAEVAMGAKR
jgi:biopolymer transport protein TolQ